ncbi:MAG: nucleotide pyrophosphohydrolase [Bifidobacteriaceae bacterium]|jgi:NTP pyrophosphatase (non-canonical NTP hydrolase)|nr:nucleotide pyrophosphohydrolase [Bifidobacteriaceae bacterium]
MISESTIQALKKFNEERDWDQFHSPENLSKSISIEAGELLECFQWDPDAKTTDFNHVQEELADVLSYCIMLADKQGWDMDDIVMRKLVKSKKKYPVEKARGISTKYTEL